MSRSATVLPAIPGAKAADASPAQRRAVYAPGAVRDPSRAPDVGEHQHRIPTRRVGAAAEDAPAGGAMATPRSSRKEARRRFLQSDSEHVAGQELLGSRGSMRLGGGGGGARRGREWADLSALPSVSPALENDYDLMALLDAEAGDDVHVAGGDGLSTSRTDGAAGDGSGALRLGQMDAAAARELGGGDSESKAGAQPSARPAPVITANTDSFGAIDALGGSAQSDAQESADGDEAGATPPPPQATWSEPPRARCGERVAYAVDRCLSARGGKARGLFVLAVLQVALCGLLIFVGRQIVDDEPEGFAESLWAAWTYVADPGTHADEADWVGRSMAFVTTVAGIIFFAMVLGFTVDGIRERMDNLKKGRSRVVETNHYLILGWGDIAMVLIQELCLAMESEGGGRIVVLSERDKTELEQELHEHFPKKALLGTEVVVRSGSPMLASELAKVSTSGARSVIVLAQSGDPDASDAEVLRTVLALIGMKHPPRGHIVAEIRDIDNEGLVEIVGRGVVETIVSHDIIGRLMVNCNYRRGLADAYESLLGFDGDEFYLEEWPELSGMKFGDLFVRFPDAIPIGVTRNRVVMLNPPDHFVMRPGDGLMVLAEDDDTYKPMPPCEVRRSKLPEHVIEPPEASTILMAGWRRDVDDVLELLDSLSEPGSVVHMLNELSVKERNERLSHNGMVPEADLDNLAIVHHVGNPSFRRDLEPLHVEQYDSVMVLSDEKYEHDAMHSDSQALACLLLIRHLQEGRGVIFDQEAILVAQAERRRRFTEGLSSRNAKGAPAHSGSIDVASDAGTSEAGSADTANTGAGRRRPPRPGQLGGKIYRDSRKTARTQKRHGLSAAAAAVGSGSVSSSDMHAKAAPSRFEGTTMGAKRRAREMVKHGVVENLVISDDIIARRREKPTAMVCELLDARTKSVIMSRNSTIAGISDFVLTTNIVARILAMVAERREVKAVLNELLGPEGNEVSVYPAAKYVNVDAGEQVSFFEIMLRGRGAKSPEIVIGYRYNEEVVMNPRDKAAPVAWTHEHSMIVMVRSPEALQRTATFVPATMRVVSPKNKGMSPGAESSQDLGASSTGLSDASKRTMRQRRRRSQMMEAEQMPGGGGSGSGSGGGMTPHAAGPSPQAGTVRSAGSGGGGGSALLTESADDAVDEADAEREAQRLLDAARRRADETADAIVADALAAATPPSRPI